MSKIYVFGSINMDIVMRSNRMPIEGETMHGDEFFCNPGGKGANQAVACSLMGGDTVMLGGVGEDDFAESCISAIESRGVNTSKIVKEPNTNTGVAVILVCDGDNRIILNGGANFNCDFNALLAVLEQNITDKDVLLCQLEMPIEQIEKAVKIAKSKGAKVILNPAPAKPLSQDLLKNVDILLPNESELELLTGMPTNTDSEVILACEKVVSMGVSEAVVTLGKRGCIHYKGEYKFHAGYPVKAVDTTSAGDTFIGCLSAQLSKGKSVDESIDMCNRASSITVQRKGAISSIPTIDEVMNTIK